MKLFISIQVMIFFLTTVACKQEANKTESTGGYTCPMHPNVNSGTPGVCPICNMTLIYVDKAESPVQEKPENSGSSSNSISLDSTKQLLAGILTDTVKYRNLIPMTALTGVVTVDQQQVTVLSSRTQGRIDKLFVRNSGSNLKTGDPVYSLYSEQLIADEKEYLSLVAEQNKNGNQKFNKKLAAAAKNKLLLQGLSELQVKKIETTGEPDHLIQFNSPVSGYVSELNVTEGSYISEGSPVLKIISLKTVWIEVQVYSNEISKYDDASSFLISTENQPGKLLEGTLVSWNPVIEEGKKIRLLRIEVKNPDGSLLPGMLVAVYPRKAKSAVIVIPKSAVLEEKMKTVWVMTRPEFFEQRMVNTGAGDKHWIEITKGLNPGEIVVSKGAYLLNSEFILKKGSSQSHEH